MWRRYLLGVGVCFDGEDAWGLRIRENVGLYSRSEN